MAVRRQSTFGVDVSKFVKVAGENTDQTFRLLVLKMFNDIVRGTPVDTGRARGSWTVGVNGLPRVFNRSNDKSGGATTSKAASRSKKLKSGGSATIATDLEYMPPLEYGHSKQAPNGMVRRAIRQFRRFMREAVREAKK